jgi:predicted TIM-barrel fold metal-dependent hydrolase
MLHTRKHEILRARYPVINVHAHFTYWLEKMSLEDMVNIMDKCGVASAVDLDGYAPNELKKRVEEYRTKYGGRFLQFYHVWFPDERQPLPDSFYQKEVDAIEEAVKMGARGVKVWRNLGLKTVDHAERLLTVDDPRLDALWTKAGELKVPVLIHVGDPDAGFLPVDRFNERFEQLRAKNDRLGLGMSYAGPGFPAKTVILQQFENIVKKHPNTMFIGAHMAESAENLQHLSSLLDRYPNLYVDISAQASELGRQPYTSRQFFIRYQDRILFGTDGNPRERNYRAYFRFLETADEYFDYPYSEVESFGRWKIYGLFLPEEVLAKAYYKNATRLLRLKDQELRDLLKLKERSASEPRVRGLA